jgi:prevent-host-death family protein
MIEVSVTEAQAGLSRLLARVQDGGRDGEPILIRRRGGAAAVLVSVEFFNDMALLRDELEAAEQSRPRHAKAVA